MSSRVWRKAKWLAILFVVMFGFRLLYGYMASDRAASDYGNEVGGDFFGSIENLRKNYASEKSMRKAESAPVVAQQASSASSQKFEKTASIKSKSSAFEQDEKRLREQTKAYKAVIQYEQNMGLAGYRQLHVMIGVAPEQFDDFYQQMRKIGDIKAAEVLKVDKTNEYRQLNAKKASLAKMLESLNELKAKNGAIADFVTLNQQILEVEKSLQELGVELGNFDAENEFCTVKLSLYEGAAAVKISFIHRVKVALEWTIKYYAALVLAALVGLMALATLLWVTDKLRLLKFQQRTA